MFKLANASQLATIPANALTFQARLAPERIGWVEVVNLSPYSFELQDDGGIVRKSVPPMSITVTQLRVRAQSLALVPVATFSTPIAASAFAIYVDVTETKPEPTSLLSGLLTSPGTAGLSVRVQDSLGFGWVSGADFGDSSTLLGGAFATNPVLSATQAGSDIGQHARSASAANVAAQSALGAALVAPPGYWSAVSTPAAGVQASASRAAGAAGVRHVAASALFSWGAIAAPVATLLQANVRDGATGAGSVLEGAQAAVPGVVFQGAPIPVAQNTPGTAATAMTAEFSAALANLAEGATINGYDAA